MNHWPIYVNCGFNITKQQWLWKKMQIEQVYSIAWKQYEMILAKPKETVNVNSQSQSSEARAGEGRWGMGWVPTTAWWVNENIKTLVYLLLVLSWSCSHCSTWQSFFIMFTIVKPTWRLKHCWKVNLFAGSSLLTTPQPPSYTKKAMLIKEITGSPWKCLIVLYFRIEWSRWTKLFRCFFFWSHHTTYKHTASLPTHSPPHLPQGSLVVYNSYFRSITL